MHFVAQALVKGVQEGRLQPSDVTEDLVSNCLYTAPCSQVDLLIRTSGETRLSDFMLWQAGLSSLAFTTVLWPEFSLMDLAWSVLDYQRGYKHLIQVSHIAVSLNTNSICVAVPNKAFGTSLFLELR